MILHKEQKWKGYICFGSCTCTRLNDLVQNELDLVPDLHFTEIIHK